MFLKSNFLTFLLGTIEWTCFAFSVDIICIKFSYTSLFLGRRVLAFCLVKIFLLNRESNLKQLAALEINDGMDSKALFGKA